MNHALISGHAETIPEHRPAADLEPAPGRCCVVLTEGRG